LVTLPLGWIPRDASAGPMSLRRMVSATNHSIQGTTALLYTRRLSSRSQYANMLNQIPVLPPTNILAARQHETYAGV